METVTLKVEYKDHDKVVLTDQTGNTYTSKSEELMDFLMVAKNISLNPDVIKSVCEHQWKKQAGYFQCVKCGEFGNATT